MLKEELKEILKDHYEWLGKRKNLLRSALRNNNLKWPEVGTANLVDSNLTKLMFESIKTYEYILNKEESKC